MRRTRLSAFFFKRPRGGLRGVFAPAGGVCLAARGASESAERGVAAARFPYCGAWQGSGAGGKDGCAGKRGEWEEKGEWEGARVQKEGGLSF